MRMMNNQLNVVPEVPSRPVNFDDELRDSVRGDSLAGLMGKKVIFRTDFSKEAIPLQSLSQASLMNSSTLLKDFSQSPRDRIVAAVDSSCALIGETEEGFIYAGRVATVFATKGSILRYHRAGPVIFYFDPATIRSSLGSNISKKISNMILLDRSIAERFIRNYLERRAQIQAAYSLTDAVILLDGALRSSVLEHRDSSLKRLQDVCEENLNQLVGLSKASSLRVISNAAGALQSNKKSQVYLDLTDSIGRFLLNCGTNRITVVRFSPNSTVFRVDFSSSNVEEESQVLSDLKYNDSFFRGYPETLRLAHHLSVFDSSTISSVRSYLAKKYDLIQIPTDDLRASILGKLV
jgi:hypothetical protein